MADKGFWGKVSTSGPPPKPGSWQFRILQAVTKAHVLIYRRTGGRLLGSFDSAPACVLHHRGAKSGEPRETPLTYLRDGADVVLIASYGGAPKSPAWYHNITATPEIEIERDGRREPMRARRAAGDERAGLWQRIVAMYPGYADYQARTEREIPVMVCEPRSL